MQRDNHAAKAPFHNSNPSDENSDPSNENKEHPFSAGFEGCTEEQIAAVMEAFRQVWDLEGPITLVMPVFDMKKYKLRRRTRKEIEQEIIKHGNLAFRSDITASSMIEQILLLFANFRNVRLTFDCAVNLDSPEFSDSNLVCFGGDSGNQIAGELFRRHKIQSPFTNVKIGRAEVCQVMWKGQTYVPRIDDKGNLLSDYGMIYKRRSELTQKKRYVYILAGGKAYATQGAAAALTMAGIIYRVFCEKRVNIEQFSLPIEVCNTSNDPLYASTVESLVRIIDPETEFYENDVMFRTTFADAYAELCKKGLHRAIIGNAMASGYAMSVPLRAEAVAFVGEAVVVSHTGVVYRMEPIWRRILQSWQIWQRNLRSKAKILIHYILGYRTLPILKASPGMAGTDIGIKDFVRFLLGYRSYRRIEIQ